MAKAVGIDLGTTNSVVAVMEGGKPTVIPNAEGNRLTPSVVGFTRTGERLVGQLARRQAVLNPENTVHSAKRLIGRRYAEVQDEIRNVPFKIAKGPNDAVRSDIMGRLYSPEEISAQILRKLAGDATQYVGEKVTEAVISVPAYFNDAQRQAAKDAGQIAGLNVLRIINEPTAAALAYGLDRKKKETVLVFDLGGGTFDVSILDIGDGVFEVRATCGDTHLGGDDFDKRIVDWLSEHFQRANGIDLRKDRQALLRLTEAAEKAKIELSSSMETHISVPFITADMRGPKHLDLQLTRSTFEQLMQDLVDRCARPLEQALADGRLTDKDIDEIILVGGLTRMPCIHALLRRLTNGREPKESVNADEVVAAGAAIEAGVLAGEVRGVVLRDVTPVSLGVQTESGATTKIIERNTAIPVRRTVDLHIRQGELKQDNRSLGHFKLGEIQPAGHESHIEMTFEIDVNGILTVTAKRLETEKEQEVTIDDSTKLSKDELERMTRDAEVHAEKDRRRREEVEARNIADSLAHQLEKQLRELGDGAPEEKARAEEMVTELRELVRTQSTDVARLRQLSRKLQQISRSLTSAALPPDDSY
jgi:molecular chaperone DnaK